MFDLLLGGTAQGVHWESRGLSRALEQPSRARRQGWREGQVGYLIFKPGDEGPGEVLKLSRLDMKVENSWDLGTWIKEEGN